MALPQPKVSNLTSSITVVLDLQVHLHDVAALGVADLADAVGVLDLADIAGVREMIHDGFLYKGITYSSLHRISSCAFQLSHTGDISRR